MKNTDVCPWWAGPSLSGKARRLLHKPKDILNNIVLPDTTVMDIGCGMGFFTLPMAKMVGTSGKVIAVDLQKEMLQGLNDRSDKDGITDRIIFHQCKQDTLNINQYNNMIDFVLVFMMLHEVPNPQNTVSEVQSALNSNGKILFAEPIIHVSRLKFMQSVKLFEQDGFQVEKHVRIPICRAVILKKSTDPL